MPDEDGSTPRQHLEARQRQTGKQPARLANEPQFWPAVEHIWNWFCQLSATRGGGFGPAPITFQDLDAWARLLEIEPTPWEIEQIMMIDREWMKVHNEKLKEKTNR